MLLCIALFDEDSRYSNSVDLFSQAYDFAGSNL